MQFCATQPHLYLHEKFIEFFSNGNIHDHEINNEKDSLVLEPTPLSKIPSKIADDIEHHQHKQKLLSNINIENIYSELSNLLLHATTNSPNGTISNSDFDYIKKSLQYIQEGLFNEKQESYNSAFELYKLAVAILIKGIQKETQQTTIKLIQEKTQQLLLKAEMIFETKLNPILNNDVSSSTQEATTDTTATLDVDGNEQNRWIIIDNFCQLSFEIEPNLANSHGSMLELNENFKIIKILEKNCYLMRNKLKTNNESGDFYYHVLKCLPKTANQQFINLNLKSIVPKTQIKYMVKFYKYYENEFTIFLLIEYKKYGELYNYFKFKASETNNKLGRSNVNNNSELLSVEEKSLKQISSFTCNLNVNFYHNELRMQNDVATTPPKQLFEIAHDSSDSKSGDDENLNMHDLNTNLLINKFNEISLNFDKIKVYLAQIVCGLESLHSMGILCKDLKPKNILFDNDTSILTFFF